MTSGDDLRRILASLDVTQLDDDCGAGTVRDLCAGTKTAYGTVASVCVWPRFIKSARLALGKGGVQVATVVNFPGGDHTASEVIAETKKVVADGADEVDVVIPWKLLLEGHPENVSARVARVKAAADHRPVKAILETGMLKTPELIRSAARGAIDGGADFLKTATGKVPVGATLAGARIMLDEISSDGGSVGFHAAGGVRTTEAALEYLALVDEVMGRAWATPATLRFGATVLLDRTVAAIRNQSIGG